VIIEFGWPVTGAHKGKGSGAVFGEVKSMSGHMCATARYTSAAASRDLMVQKASQAIAEMGALPKYVAHKCEVLNGIQAFGVASPAAFRAYLALVNLAEWLPEAGVQWGQQGAQLNAFKDVNDLAFIEWIYTKKDGALWESWPGMAGKPVQLTPETIARVKETLKKARALTAASKAV